jgi:cyclophilin family peptidyl-prolyl cis-trans isomerase
MTLVSALVRVRRLATVGLVAMLLAGCTSIPVVTPAPTPTLPPTLPPTTPAYTLGPTMAPDACPTSAPAAFTGTATVTMTTNYGDMVIKVDGSLGANAAGAFLALAKCGYYNNIIFHRVIPTFVIQAGDGTYARLPNLGAPARFGTGGPTWTITDDPVKVAYKRGTIAMANKGSGAPNSGNSQFFMVLADDSFPAGTTGYSIFGNVTSGLDVMDKIANVPTGGEPSVDQTTGQSTPSQVPLSPIVITSTLVTTP